MIAQKALASLFKLETCWYVGYALGSDCINKGLCNMKRRHYDIVYIYIYTIYIYIYMYIKCGLSESCALVPQTLNPNPHLNPKP